MGSASSVFNPKTTGDVDMQYWAQVAGRLARPILGPLAAGELKRIMPVEAGDSQRSQYTHLEAFGRLMCGLAPWIENGVGGGIAELRDLALSSLSNATNPKSPDFMNFSVGTQPLVDAAHLAQGLLRAPRALIDGLSRDDRNNVVDALTSTRRVLPVYNNWILFGAMIEAALFRFGEQWDPMRVDYAVRQFLLWYKGDGFYGDGPEFHWDYYNSLVIHPMLIDVLDNVGGENRAWSDIRDLVIERSRRQASILERLISPDGTYPPIGRSLAYRYGAFHTLAQLAMQHRLPHDLPPGQVRAGLTAVIRRVTDAPQTFDEDGYLRIGLAGAQPSIGERYVSTGSLYLCSTVLLPLGLPTDDPFWREPPRPWTQVSVWSGVDIEPDHALAPWPGTAVAIGALPKVLTPRRIIRKLRSLRKQT